jgi:peptidoglycan/xylan/chitin deacetylase (PgdA/CDA1 family)
LPAFACLCYHSINAAPIGPHAVSPDRFERQLSSLRRWRYAPVSVRDLDCAAEWRRRRRVLLSFDDGFRDTYTHAFPLLRAYGFTALVFVLPSLVDRAARFTWSEVAADVIRYPDVFRSVSWRQVELMAEAGLEVGSHTASHPMLTDLSDERLQQELLDSRSRIRARLGRCDCIAYPFGAWDSRVALAARSAGYRYGFSLPYGSARVGWQRGHTTMAIPRIAIDDRDDEQRLRLKLTGPGRRLLLSPAKSAVRAWRR